MVAVMARRNRRSEDEARINRLAQRIAELTDHNTSLQERIAALQERKEALEQQVEELEDELNDAEEAPILGEDDIRELAQIRTALKAGRADEGRERLERVLDGLDSCWRLKA